VTYRVQIDPKSCAGTSNCVEEAPAAFLIGEDGLARAMPQASAADLLRGAEACPISAISLYDTTTGKRVFP
jgi:ferredoxin